ncbi:DNA repair protein RecN [Symbiobacterium terraclitae]|uniref:DNA repair protein RecN n=1 Tax=Symbiobacterium terraclitae TaxID=557451 RepID=UPI0035B56A00
MLIEIAIEQFALIDHVRLQFTGGLNVLTGETGAGKSIILDAVQAVLGGRTSADVVRAGEERAVVEAVFDLVDAPESAEALRRIGVEVDEDGLLVIRREIARNGRGAIRLNGRTVTAGMLREAAQGLMDLHGQHEHQSLLQAEKHLDLLDQYGGSLLTTEGKPLELLDRYAGLDLSDLRARLAGVVQRLHGVQAELKGLLGDERDRARREDLLRFQVEELRAARLRPGEEEELEAEHRLLANAERLKRVAAQSYAALYEGDGGRESAVDLLGRVRSELEDAMRLDPGLAEAVEMVSAALVHAQEASHLLADYQERVELDPRRLAEVEARLDQLATLKRKYGDSVEEMLAYLAEVDKELERLEHSQELIAELTEQEAALGREAESLAAALSAARREAAGRLGERVAQELADLGMPNARFVVAVESPAEPSYRSVTARGWDRVEFLFSPNPGEPVKPLAKIVSGGEMSRIMLALKAILARVDNIPSLVFDEVDTGISGRAAQAVGEKLALIAGDRQVLCVTHLPQVAALADRHFRIEKATEGGRTTTRCQPLDDDGRAEEIARMIGGAEVSHYTMAAARDMIRAAEQLKASLRQAAASL